MNFLRGIFYLALHAVLVAAAFVVSLRTMKHLQQSAGEVSEFGDMLFLVLTFLMMAVIVAVGHRVIRRLMPEGPPAGTGGRHTDDGSDR